MPDFSGPIQSFEVASWLWLIVLLPFTGALVNVLYCSGLFGSLVYALRFAFSEGDADPKTAKPTHAARVAPRGTSARVLVVSLALSFATAAWYVKVLAVRAPGTRLLLCHVWQLVRAGQLEAGVDLAFDPLAATLVIVVTGLATLLALYSALAGEAGTASDDEAWRFFGLLGALVGSVLVVLLADNLLLLLVGWAGVGRLGFRLVRRLPGTVEATSGRALVVQRVGDACLLLATCMLFWGAGGEWSSSGDYQSDLEPRIAAVSVTEGDKPLPADDPSLRGGAATQGKGFLTVAAVPGALVYMDDSHTPLLDDHGLPQRTPFARREVPGGAHSFRFAPDDTFRLGDAKVPFVVEGGVLPNYSIARFAVGGDREVSLSVIGPTLRFRELADQLRMVDAKGVHRLRDALLRRKVQGRFGPELVALVCFLFLLGATLKSLPMPLAEWLPMAPERAVATSVLVHASGMAIAAGYLVSRLACLFAPSPLASALVACLGIGLAAVGAFGSVLQYDLRRVLAFASLSQLGLAFVAIGVHAYTTSILQLTTHAIVMSGLLVAVGFLPKGTDMRQMGGLAASSARAAASYRLGCAALTSAPVPFLSGYWPLAGVLEGTFLPADFASVAGTVLYALVLLTAGLASFGLWRSYYVVFAGPRPAEKKEKSTPSAMSPGLSRIVAVLGLLSVVVGGALGASARDVGGDGESMLEEWLGPVFRGIHPTEFFFVSRLGLVGAGFGVALVGWWAARRRYGDSRPRDWAEREASLPGQALGASLR